MDLYEAPWSELDPGAHPFDLDRVRPRIDALVEQAARAERPSRGALVAELEGLLTTEHGAWIGGWRWGGGGPVRPAAPGDVRAAARRMLEEVASWRGFLEELAARFAELRAEAATRSFEAVVERAAARLLPIVLERTGTDGAWYARLSLTLGWFLDDLLGEYASAELKEVVADVVSGHFSSWIGPDDDTAREACAALGAAVAQASAPFDALAAWRRIRHGVFGDFTSVVGAPPRSPVLADGHERFIDEVDRRRDPARADRMASALVLCRDSARRGLQLTFDQLAEWQAVVLGLSAPAPFRTGPAHAKAGRERYPLTPDTQRHFEAALAGAHGHPDHAVVRAARAYLDVCFFHPFDDGNARSARLALDHVLTSAGLALHGAGPLFVLPRAAGDVAGTQAFARAIEQLVGRRAE